MPKQNDTPTDEAEAPMPRSFTVWLAKLANGEADSNLAYELSQLLQRLDEEAHARNKEVVGTLTFKLKLMVDETGAVGVTYQTDSKAPPRKTTPAIFWLNKKSQLVENNPRQQDLPIRGIDGGRREIRNVESGVTAPREV